MQSLATSCCIDWLRLALALLRQHGLHRLCRCCVSKRRGTVAGMLQLMLVEDRVSPGLCSSFEFDIAASNLKNAQNSYLSQLRVQQGQSRSLRRLDSSVALETAAEYLACTVGSPVQATHFFRQRLTGTVPDDIPGSSPPPAGSCATAVAHMHVSGAEPLHLPSLWPCTLWHTGKGLVCVKPDPSA